MYTVTGLAGIGHRQVQIPLGEFVQLADAREAAKEFIRSEYRDIEKELPLRGIRSYDVDVFASIDSDEGPSRGFFPAHGRKYSFVEVEGWEESSGKKTYLH